MPETIAGFPFWELAFDAQGQPRDRAAIDTFVAEVPARGLTDLFIFSHGWNNDRATARFLYKAFFNQLRKVVDDATPPRRRQATIGTAGVIWPSILFPDEQPGAGEGGGAASLGGGAAG